MKTQLSTAFVLVLSYNFVAAAPNFAAMGEGLPPPPHHAPPFERLLAEFDVNQDGAISQDEVQFVLEGTFQATDANSDGFLTATELETIHAQKHEAHLAEEFAKLDTNGDGGISTEELSVESRHPLAHHFTDTDSNGDGLVTLEEMKATLQARMAERQMQPQKLMRIDSDGDGLISLVEFTTHLPMFDHLDANEDGTITAEEAAQQQPPMTGPAGESQRGKRGNFKLRP